MQAFEFLTEKHVFDKNTYTVSTDRILKKDEMGEQYHG